MSCLYLNCLKDFVIKWFLTVACLHCCVWAFSHCSDRGHSSLWCAGFSCCGARSLGTCAPAAEVHRLSSCSLQVLECKFSGCGAWTLLLCDMWDFPTPGNEPMSPALAGVFFSFSLIFISWQLITSQHFSGFCHTLTWISHGVTCVPH